MESNTPISEDKFIDHQSAEQLMVLNDIKMYGVHVCTLYIYWQYTLLHIWFSGEYTDHL